MVDSVEWLIQLNGWFSWMVDSVEWLVGWLVGIFCKTFFSSEITESHHHHHHHLQFNIVFPYQHEFNWWQISILLACATSRCIFNILRSPCITSSQVFHVLPLPLCPSHSILQGTPPPPCLNPKNPSPPKCFLPWLLRNRLPPPPPEQPKLSFTTSTGPFCPHTSKITQTHTLHKHTHTTQTHTLHKHTHYTNTHTTQTHTYTHTYTHTHTHTQTQTHTHPSDPTYRKAKEAKET